MFMADDGIFLCAFLCHSHPYQLSACSSLHQGYCQVYASQIPQHLQGSDSHVHFPSDWDLTLLQECDKAVGMLCKLTTMSVCSNNIYCLCKLAQTNYFFRQTTWRAEDYVEDNTKSNRSEWHGWRQTLKKVSSNTPQKKQTTPWIHALSRMK